MLHLNEKEWLKFKTSDFLNLAASFCPDSSPEGFRIVAEYMSWVSLTGNILLEVWPSRTMLTSQYTGFLLR